MASTNKTEHYDLSQFVPLDKPAWLGDYNSDMKKIAAGIYAAQSKADSLGTEVETASAAATAAQQAAQSANEAAQQASEKAQDAETTANGVAATASQALTTAQQAQTAAEQAQSAAIGALKTSGGTMTGPLVLNGDPTENLQAATKQYVDNKSSKNTNIFLNSSNVGSKVQSSNVNGVITFSNNIIYINAPYMQLTEALETGDVLFTVTFPYSGTLNQNSKNLPIFCFDNTGVFVARFDLKLALSGSTLTLTLNASNSTATSGKVVTAYATMSVF